MKNLFLFLLVLAAAGLFFHDKQQTADLNAERDKNDQLTQQLAAKETAFNALQAKVTQLTAQLASPAAVPAAPAGPAFGQYRSPVRNQAQAPQPAESPGSLQSGGLNSDGASLDRPAYH